MDPPAGTVPNMTESKNSHDNLGQLLIELRTRPLSVVRISGITTILGYVVFHNRYTGGWNLGCSRTTVPNEVGLRGRDVID